MLIQKSALLTHELSILRIEAYEYLIRLQTQILHVVDVKGFSIEIMLSVIEIYHFSLQIQFSSREIAKVYYILYIYIVKHDKQKNKKKTSYKHRPGV